MTLNEHPVEPDDFRGDNANLKRSIEALLSMDADGVLVPHGIGGHARALLTSAYHRIPADDSVAKVEKDGLWWVILLLLFMMFGLSYFMVTKT